MPDGVRTASMGGEVEVQSVADPAVEEPRRIGAVPCLETQY